MSKSTRQLDFENATVRLVGCMHPHAARLIPNRMACTDAVAAGKAALVVCELCGSATRDDGRTWKAPMLVQELADATNAISAERASAAARALPTPCPVCKASPRTHACDEEACEPKEGA